MSFFFSFPSRGNCIPFSNLNEHIYMYLRLCLHGLMFRSAFPSQKCNTLCKMQNSIGLGSQSVFVCCCSCTFQFRLHGAFAIKWRRIKQCNHVHGCETQVIVLYFHFIIQITKFLVFWPKIPKSIATAKPSLQLPPPTPSPILSDRFDDTIRSACTLRSFCQVKRFIVHHSIRTNKKHAQQKAMRCLLLNALH